MRCALLLVAIAACTDAKTEIDPTTTAIEVSVHLDTSLGVDRLSVSGTVGNMQAFAPGMVPDDPRPLGADESFAILVPDSLDGQTVLVRVDGLANNTIVMSGGVSAPIQLHHVSDVDLTMGAPAICGDGVVRDPLETCDDDNVRPGDGCSATCETEPGWICNAAGGLASCRLDTFDVVSAVATSNHQIAVTFSAPPDPVAAVTLANYMIPSLGVTGTPLLSGSTVTLTTASQSSSGYDVIVSNVTRASDAKPLTTTVAPFAGRAAFEVASAASTSDTAVIVTFSAPPDPVEGAKAANYAITGLTINAAVVAGSAVTLTTTPQSSQSYTVTVTNVTRASDTEPLLVTDATFTGRDGFDVSAAQSVRNRVLSVTFNAPPNPGQATTLGNYAVTGLTLTGTPVLNGATVTIATSAQAVTAYTLAVSNVTRASDGVALTIASAPFTGKPIVEPLVTNVVPLSTSPNNGTTAFTTGTTTIRITGTDFTTVTCPSGVRLDDRDGADNAVNTVATSCTVDSDTQITAVIPAGARTNGATGWNVIVTNTIGANAASDVTFVPHAGLLVSEVFTGSSAAPDHDFVELYNPTAQTLDLGALGLALHLRAADGTDTAPALTLMRTTVPSHGFFLIVSQTSMNADPWFAHRDGTYRKQAGEIVVDGGLYISQSATANARVLDKVGWGAQLLPGYEGSPIVQIPLDQSAQRKPAGGAGAATDTDDNGNDFLPASAAITPLGSTDPPQ